MNVSIIGTGYVGLVTAACFAELGHVVVGMDSDAGRVLRLKEGEVPFHEPGLEELVGRHLGEGLSFTTHLPTAMANADVVFICVPTPTTTNGTADLSAVESVAAAIGALIHRSLVIVNKSTVPVGSVDLVDELVRAAAPPGAEFEVVSNPEFLREGSAIQDFLNPDRVVLGVHGDRSRDLLQTLYRPLSAPIMIVSPQTAELIKYASNAFLSTKISFINAVARICDAVGADVADVSMGMGLDHRIGMDFLEAGPGFGGSCFPKDCAALIATSAEIGHDFGLLRETLAINDGQIDYLLARVQAKVGDLDGRTIGLWGLSFKAETDDVRESPSLKVIRRLLDAGARVQAFDPVVRDVVYRTLGIERAEDALEAVRGAHALFILTGWRVFSSTDLASVKRLMADPVLVDARNLVDPDEAAAAGFTYLGVGRGPGRRSGAGSLP